MNHRETAACQGFVDYMAGEMTDVERKRFERHLETCAACREDAAEWNYVWHRLSEEVPLVEPPNDLRQEVLDAAFAASLRDEKPLEPSEREWSVPQSRSGIGAPIWRRFAIAVVMLAVFFAGFGLRPLLTAPERPAIRADGSPSQIERVLPLAPVASAMLGDAAKRAYGVTCLIRSAGEQRLVVYVFGTPVTKGGEAYHVWLLKDGNRSSAGTFTVGESGIGLLSIPWPEPSPIFDGVGITLEPDAGSSEPTGPKIFGSV